jgi:hypothetical protein
MTAATERAWSDVHDLMPEDWQVGPLTYDPGVKGWSVTARTSCCGYRSTVTLNGWQRWSGGCRCVRAGRGGAVPTLDVT